MSRAAGPVRRAPAEARGAAPTRQAEATRRALIEAATTVFAEQGYDAGSVRAITGRARANQAAITYHFGGKEGLYREVLRAAGHLERPPFGLAPDDASLEDLVDLLVRLSLAGLLGSGGRQGSS